MAKLTKTRANKGGEYGVNGEFYNGGQFLPGSELTEKGANKRSKSKFDPNKKQEIAGYKWELPPFENAKAIYPLVSGITKFHKTGYSKENGLEGCFQSASETFVNNDWWTQERIQGQDELIEKWNSGQRWM